MGSSIEINSLALTLVSDQSPSHSIALSIKLVPRLYGLLGQRSIGDLVASVRLLITGKNLRCAVQTSGHSSLVPFNKDAGHVESS